MKYLKRFINLISINFALNIFILLQVTVFFLGDLIKYLELYLILNVFITTIYLFLIYKVISAANISLKPFVIVGACIAILYLFMNTNLSSDMYRYIWDGSLTNSHLNPYYYRPIDPAMEPFRQNTDLYSRMGWTNQYTVYPPLAQLIFFVAYKAYTILGYLGAKIVMAVPVVALGFYLYKNYSQKLVALYAVNPIILFECFYGAHIDIWAVLFTVFAYHFYKSDKYRSSAVLLALGIVTKIFPIIFLPLFLIDLIKRKKYLSAAQYLGITSLVVVLFYIPFIQESLFPITRYQSWVGDNEFNSSTYVITKLILASYLPQDITLVSRVGVLLFGIGNLFLWKKKISVNILILGMLLYLIVSPVVYPWYTLLFIPLALIGLQQSQKIAVFISLTILQGILSLTYIDQLLGITESTKKDLLHIVTIIFYSLLVIFTVIVAKRRQNQKPTTSLPDLQ